METFKTKTQLNKHNHDGHSLQLTALIQNSKSTEYILFFHQLGQSLASYTVNKTACNFI